MKNTIYLLALLISVLSSCSSIMRDNGCSNTGSGDSTMMPDITDAKYLNDIDEYVSYIRENVESLNIVKNDTQKEKMVLFMKDSDTVKISVLADSNACTDIYFQNSTPIFVTRNVILDVDSCYLETAYFKNGKVYKCFKDGEEVSDDGSINHYEQLIMGK